MRSRCLLLCFSLALPVLAAPQERPTLPDSGSDSKTASRRLPDGSVLLAAGTRIPLSVMNSVSSRNAQPGDQVYLQTMIPTAVDGQTVIPAGAYVIGKITQAERPGKVKGRGQLALVFERLMLSSGASIDLAGGIDGIDGENPGTLDRKEGKVTSEGSAGRDAMMIGGGALGGTAAGRWAGRSGRNAGIGAGAGAAAGLAGVLLTRGPDAMLRRGSTLEMVLHRDVTIPADTASGASSARPPARRR